MSYCKEDPTLQYAAWLAAGQYEDGQLPRQLITANYTQLAISMDSTLLHCM